MVAQKPTDIDAVQPIRWVRARCTFTGGKDTLYRIHGTNQPEWIGHAISSGCIRLTNEDVIDLYGRVKTGALVVVLGPKQGPARVASAGSSALNGEMQDVSTVGKFHFCVPPASLDHLVGERLDRVGDFEAERPGRLQVDDKLEFG